jgi:16S rRNA (guanine527-N7)-methyltransferase
MEDKINTFSSFYQVSRETISSLVKYEKILIKANKNLNLIGKSTINTIWTRHILDSYQVIDFIEENDKTLVDIGSGAGFPGLVIAIAAKEKKIPIKINLIEKSSKKTKFLTDVVNKLNLDVKVTCENILKSDKKIYEEILVARAFKPLPIILKLIHNKAQKYKKFFIFLGKTGKNELLQASKSWDIEYKQRVSITSKDSLIIEISKLKKIN